MTKATVTSIFISSFISGIFTAVGTDPNEEIAKAFNQIIDSLCQPGYEWNCFIYKILIFSLFVIIPILLDVVFILKVGNIGIIIATLGFSSGFIIIYNSIIGASLLILGMLITYFYSEF